jgi:tetratricopeptide (TPR) repeat protein
MRKDRSANVATVATVARKEHSVFRGSGNKNPCSGVKIFAYVKQLRRATIASRNTLRSFRATILVVAALCSLSAAVAGEPEWKALNDQVVPLMTSGNLDKAEQLARQGLAEAEKSFGPAHRNTEISVGNLALVLRFQKRYEESEKHYRRALALREKSLGEAHPSTALMMLNLADVLQAQKKFAEAEKLQRTVLPIFEKAHGDDPKTATALNNLGANLQMQARYKEAEPVLRRALAMKEKTLGSMSQSVANTLTNLAEVCEALGRKDEAAKFRARVLEIQKLASAKV